MRVVNSYQVIVCPSGLTELESIYNTINKSIINDIIDRGVTAVHLVFVYPNEDWVNQNLPEMREGLYIDACSAFTLKYLFRDKQAWMEDELKQRADFINSLVSQSIFCQYEHYLASHTNIFKEIEKVIVALKKAYPEVQFLYLYSPLSYYRMLSVMQDVSKYYKHVVSLL